MILSSRGGGFLFELFLSNFFSQVRFSDSFRIRIFRSTEKCRFAESEWMEIQVFPFKSKLFSRSRRRRRRHLRRPPPTLRNDAVMTIKTHRFADDPFPEIWLLHLTPITSFLHPLAFLMSLKILLQNSKWRRCFNPCEVDLRIKFKCGFQVWLPLAQILLWAIFNLPLNVLFIGVLWEASVSEFIFKSFLFSNY